MTNNLLQRQKYHQYKMFSPAGVYLGLLPNVVSDFGYNQNIATAFTQVQITVAQSADTASQTAQPITDETGANITDEQGANILMERQPDLVGANNSFALIANDNLVQIWEYSNYYPNGLLVFSGYISKWKTVFGAANNIIVTCLSQGTDMTNVMPTTGDTAYITQATDDGTNFPISAQTTSKISTISAVCQTFTMAANEVIGAVSCEVTTPEAGTLNAQIYQMLGSSPNPQTDTQIASGSLAVGIISTKTVEKISFTSTPTLNTGLTYYILVDYFATSNDDAAGALYASSANPYANGQLYTAVFSSTAWTVTGYASDDMYFVLWQHSSQVTISYINDDLSFILNDLMTNYNSQGGQILVPSGGYANTGTLLTYTFKDQTIVQCIQTIAALMPNWYWYVDPALGQLIWAKQNTVADITLIKGRHMDELDIEATKENIKNIAYFSGGDDGTSTSTNIFVKVTNSQGSNRIGMVQLSDNRVNSTSGGAPTARQLAQAYLNQYTSETYITNVTVQDQTMDINLVKLGKTIGFSGFGTFVDSLLLQNSGVNLSPDQSICQIGTLPKRNTKVVSDILSALSYAQTVANPATPS